MQFIRLKLKNTIFPGVIIFGSLALMLASLYSYILFHTLVEVMTIVVSFGIFVIAWASRRYISNYFLLILGIGYFFIGSLDFLHAMGFKGMPIFPTFSSDEPTKFWILARYLESITFFVALIFLEKDARREFRFTINKSDWIFFGYATIMIVSLLAIFYWNVFPAAYIEGQGMTMFKKVSEYVISAIFIASIFLLWRKRKILDSQMVNLLSLALIVKVASELAFTGYVGVDDFTNMLGHIFKFVSFVILYKAVLEIGLMKPYSFLFLDLKKSQEEYQASQNELQRRIEEQLGDAYQHLGIANRKISLLLEIEEHSHIKKNKEQIISHILDLAKKAAHAQIVMLYANSGDSRYTLINSPVKQLKKYGNLRTVTPEQAGFLQNIKKEKKRFNAVCDPGNVGCFFEALKMNYFVALPLIQENSCGGFLFLGFEKRRSMESQELEFLDVFSIHASNALYRLKVIK